LLGDLSRRSTATDGLDDLPTTLLGLAFFAMGISG
jgi:hypothetical protein